MNQNAGENIIDKLNGALATFRRERDDLHRSKELAVERLRLVRADREAMEKSLLSMKERLRKLKESTSGNDELSRLEHEVKQLRTEARFQHSELVGKKEKMSRLESKRKEEARTRELSMSACREALRRRREKSSKKERKRPNLHITMSIDEKKRKIEKFIELGGCDEFLTALPELIKRRIADVLNETNDIRQESDTLERRIVGYQKELSASTQLDEPGQNTKTIQQ